MQNNLIKMANGVDKHPKPHEQPPIENPGWIPTDPTKNPPVEEPPDNESGIQDPPPPKLNNPKVVES